MKTAILLPVSRTMDLGGGDHDDEANTPELAHEIELRYRLYAVTDQDGDASDIVRRPQDRAGGFRSGYGTHRAPR